MSYIDDMGYEDYGYPDFSGIDKDKIWTTSDGEDIEFKDLKTSHIKNIIRLFEVDEEDMPNLFKELASRK